jgi:mono/diheme cytochrome c family protein
MRVSRVFRIAFVSVVVVPLLGLGSVYVVSERELRRLHALPVEEPLSTPIDSVSLARGAHLVHTIGTCALCHAPDLGGKVYMDGGLLGLVAGPNLTTGRGGVGGELSDADWERAIRHGVRRDGTSLIVMPSELYTHLSDSDLAAMVAYLKQVPPVNRDVEPTHFRLLGRALLASGRLPLLVASKTPRVDHSPSIPVAEDAEYGRYLANIGGCHGCHGYGLSGGRVAGPPDLPLASNITPAGLVGWTEADFIRLMREGVRPNGERLDDFMPWQFLGGMSDSELRAVWMYLKSVPSREFGNK